MKNTILFLALFASKSLSAQYLLKDIATTNRNSGITQGISNSNGTYFFTDPNIIENSSNVDFWKTDGTINGTFKIKTYINKPKLLSASSNLAFFVTGNFGSQSLWVSNGSSTGTSIIKSNFQNIVFTISGGPYLFFYHCTGNSIELWRSDGTSNGTIFIKTFGNSCGWSTSTTCFINNNLYFNVFGSNGNELWKTDGNTAILVKNDFYNSLSQFIEFNNNLYFSVGGNLWKSDGTYSGTNMLFNGSSVLDISKSGNNIFFIAGDGFLRKIGNTPSDIVQVAYVGNDSFTKIRGKIGNTIFFTKNNARELWKSDGTNTQKVKDIRTTDPNIIYDFYYQKYFSANTLLYFWDNDDNGGKELWQTDGTTAGTRTLKDIYPLLNFKTAFPISLLNGNKMVFTAYDNIHGVEPWITDGTTNGTLFLKDINTFNQHQNQDSQSVGLNGKVYFVGNDVEHGNELWQTDGTTAGTSLLYDFTKHRKIEYFAESNGDYSHTDFGGMIAYKGMLLIGIWGMNNTTELLKYENNVMSQLSPAVNSGSSGGDNKQNFTIFKDEAYFATPGGIYKTNGTTAGTVQLNNTLLAFTSKLTVMGDYLYFVAQDFTGQAIFRTNGVAITVVKYLNADYIANNSQNSLNEDTFYKGDNYIYFTTNSQQKLWRTDGTNAGTILLKDFIYSYTTGISFASLNGKTYFKGTDNFNYGEPWETDGTVAGTKIFKDMLTNGASSPREFTVVDNKLFFVTSDNTIWQTDGSLVSLTPLTGSYNYPNLFFSANERLLFSTSANNLTLHQKNSNSLSPSVFYQFNGGNGMAFLGGLLYSSNKIFLHYNGKLYFRMDDGNIGTEFYVINLCAVNYNLNKDQTISQNSIKYESDRTIIAQNQITGTANVKYDAGKSILLIPGFKVETGAVFKAYIDGCTNDNN